jgi:CubicO group peptidase (beta-lactamase class C family)
MQNRAGLLFLLFLFLLRILAVAQPVTASAHDIEPFVTRTLRDIPLVPDVGIAVVRDGKAYTRNGGTAYYIASSTKAFTGLACAILAARGAIDLDAPITRYLPEVTMAPPLDAGKLTLRQFLTHTSGIANGAITFRLTSPIEAYTQPESGRVELIPGSGEVLHFTFGDGEKASAVTYDEAVFERVE